MDDVYTVEARSMIKCRGCKHEYEGEIKFGVELPYCPECGGRNYPHPPVTYKGKDFDTNNMRSRREVNSKSLTPEQLAGDEPKPPVVRKPKIRKIRKGDKY